MKRVLYAALPFGLALILIGVSWGILTPRVSQGIYFSLIGFGALCVIAGVVSRRRTQPGEGGGRTVKMGAGALASVGLSIALLLLVNFFSIRYQERWDLTETRSFSLHPATQRVLSQVKEEIEVYAFVPASRILRARNVKNLYEIFAFEQPLLKVEVVDPTQRPDLVDELGVRTSNVTIVRRGDRASVFPGHEEADLAAAILEVGRTEPRIIYWVTGFGSRTFDAQGGQGYNQLVEQLGKEYYEVRTLSIGAGESVPEDASLVVFADPEDVIPEDVAERYNEWLRNGGRALLLADVDFNADPNSVQPLEPIAARWGLRAQPAVVIDPRDRIGSGSITTAIGDAFGSHESVAALAGDMTVFTVARPIEFFEVQRDRQVFHHVLVQVGPANTPLREPYVEPDLERAKSNQSVNVVEQQKWMGRGRRVAAAAYRSYEALPGSAEAGRETRVVMIGDADFATDRELSRESNSDLIMNLVRWLAGEELLIQREGEGSLAKEAMSLEPAQLSLIQMVVVLIPVIVFLCGWVLWFVRRSK